MAKLSSAPTSPLLQRAEDGQEAGLPYARSAHFLVSSLGVIIFQRSVGPSIALSAMPSFRALDFSDDLAIFATVFGSEYDYTSVITHIPKSFLPGKLPGAGSVAC